MSTTKKTIISFSFYLLTAVGVSLSVKANVGVASVNAFCLTMTNLIPIKVGTMIFLFNYIFIGIYMVLTKFQYKMIYVVQFVSITLFGSVVNLLLYNIFTYFELTNYILQVLFLTLGVTIAGLSIGVITYLHTITFPIETTCHQLDKMNIISFMKARYGLDVILISIALIITFVFQTDLYVREGTIISMAIFSFAMHSSKRFVEYKYPNI